MPVGRCTRKSVPLVDQMTSRIITPPCKRPLVSALAALSMVMACSVARANTPARNFPQIIEFWTMQLSPHLDDYVLDVVRRFEIGHPGVKVKWVDIPWSEMERKVLTSVAAKSPPDVVNLNPQFSAKLAEFGALANPEVFMSPEQRQAYVPAAWAANRLAGRTFAVPWYLTTNITLVNTALLKQAQLPVPTQFQELLGLSPQLKQRTGAYAYFPALDGSAPLENLVAMGADLKARTGCGAGFVNAQGEAVFSFYRDMYAQGYTPRNVVTEGHRKGVELFLSGQVAVISSGMQFLGSIRSNNPVVYKTVDIAPQLGVTGVKPNIAAMNLAVLESSPRKALAFEFAAFVTAPEQQMAFARRVPILPSTLVSYSDPFFTQADPQDLASRARVLSAQQVLQGEVVVPPMANYNKLKTNYARNLQATMLGTKTVAQALEDTGREWTALMGCKP